MPGSGSLARRHCPRVLPLPLPLGALRLNSKLGRGFAISQTPTRVSQRGTRAPGLLPSYLADARGVTPWEPGQPDGCLNLSVAENQSLEDLLVRCWHQCWCHLPVPAATRARFNFTAQFDTIFYRRLAATTVVVALARRHGLGRAHIQLL